MSKIENTIPKYTDLENEWVTWSSYYYVGDVLYDLTDSQKGEGVIKLAIEDEDQWWYDMI